MNRISLLAALLATASIGFGQIQLPCDFEVSPITADFTDFDGGVASVLANPDPSGLNTSATVASIVRNPGATWAGSYLTLAQAADFTTNPGLKMQFWSPEANVFVRIKFESDMGFVELDEWVSQAGEWIELKWDFSNLPSGAFNRLVFMFDVFTVGDGSATSTFYFDNIEWFNPSDGLAQTELPLTFEDPTVYHHTYGFAGSASWLAADPNDATNQVVEVLKTGLALDYSGVVLTNRNGLANAIPFTAEEQVLRARIWSPDVGLPVLMKVENKNDPAIFSQTLATTETVGWDTLEFNFANPTEGSPGIDLNLVYDLPVVFFNFGWTGELFGPLTFRIDDVSLGALNETVETVELIHYNHLVTNVLMGSDVLRWHAPLNGLTRVRLFDQQGRCLTDECVRGDRFALPTLPVGWYIVHWEEAGFATAERIFIGG